MQDNVGVTYWISFHTVDGYAGGEKLKAANDYEAALKFQELRESGKYTWLSSSKLTREELLSWGV